MWLSREPWSRLTAPPSLRGAHRLWHFPTGDSCVGLAQHFRGFPLKDILGPMVACKIYVLIPLKQMTPDVERNLSVGIEIFRRAGTYASAFGWVGVLIGLAIISKNATPYNLEELGPALSICILPALYGTVLHYLVFLPIRTKLSRIQADLVIQAS